MSWGVPTLGEEHRAHKRQRYLAVFLRCTQFPRTFSIISKTYSGLHAAKCSDTTTCVSGVFALRGITQHHYQKVTWSSCSTLQHYSFSSNTRGNFCKPYDWCERILPYLLLNQPNCFAVWSYPDLLLYLTSAWSPEASVSLHCTNQRLHLLSWATAHWCPMVRRTTSLWRQNNGRHYRSSFSNVRQKPMLSIGTEWLIDFAHLPFWESRTPTSHAIRFYPFRSVSKTNRVASYAGMCRFLFREGVTRNTERKSSKWAETGIRNTKMGMTQNSHYFI